MGLFLIGALIGGCFVGLLIAAIPANIGVAITVKRANSCRQAWKHFGVAYAASLAILLTIIYNYPFPHVRPGNDYDIYMKVLFQQGAAYTAALGIAAILAGLIVLFSTRDK